MIESLKVIVVQYDYKNLGCRHLYFRFESYQHFRSFQLPATAKSARDDVADARRQANRLAFNILWSRIASTGLAIQGRVRNSSGSKK